jgi:hypothetical protein
MPGSAKYRRITFAKCGNATSGILDLVMPAFLPFGTIIPSVTIHHQLSVLKISSGLEIVAQRESISHSALLVEVAKSVLAGFI